MSHIANAASNIQKKSNQQTKTTKRIEPYTKILNKIMDNEKLSPLAKLLIFYLTRRPKDWIPRPSDMKRHLQCGERIWRRTLKELKEAGYLRLKSGGNGRGGSQLEFDYKGRFRDDRRDDHISIPEMITSINVTNNNKSINKQHIKETTKQHISDPIIEDEKVVVGLIERLKKETGLSKASARKCLIYNSYDKIIEKLGMLQKAKGVRNPSGWIIWALKDDIKDNIINLEVVKCSESERIRKDAEAKKLNDDALASYNARMKNYRSCNKPKIAAHG